MKKERGGGSKKNFDEFIFNIFKDLMKK